MEKERDESTSQIAQFKAKIAEFEKRGMDTTALSEQLAKEQKEKADLQSQIRALKREASPEFKDKWDKPFNQAAEFAKQFVEQLPVLNEDGEATRNATWDDFVGLYSLPYSKAVVQAKLLFGDAAAGVVQHLNDLKKLDFQRGIALKEEQTRWQETEKQEAAKSAQQREFIQQTWATVNKDMAEKAPEWYLDDPKDPEGNALLKEGFEIVDSRPSTVQEQIVHDAYIRLNAAAAPRLKHRIRRLQEQLEDAQAKISELQGSAPGKVQKPASGDSPKPQDRKGMAGISADLREALQGS